MLEIFSSLSMKNKTLGKFSKIRYNITQIYFYKRDIILRNNYTLIGISKYEI